ncbi:arginyltransferase [Alphaproteobacteria bacterium]|nr:arginyltransferase [Alphaproteobacteria bacterium]
MSKFEKVNLLNYPIFFMTKETKCPYLENESEKRLVTDLNNNPFLFDELSVSGFRRIENWMYRPSCSHCTECKSYRVNLKKFSLSKSLKRIRKNNSEINIVLKKNLASEEYFHLFSNYQNNRHKGSSMSNMTFDDFKSMIETSPINTQLYEFRNKEKLIGLMLFDYQKDGLSAVYSFYDVKYEKKGLGNFMILELIELANKLNLDYVYLGYYIKNAQRMNYKLKFKEGELFSDGKWTKI